MASRELRAIATRLTSFMRSPPPRCRPTPSWGTTGTIGGHPSGGQAPLSPYGKQRRDVRRLCCFPSPPGRDKMSGMTSLSSERRLLALELGVIAPTVVGGAFLIATHAGEFDLELIWWALAVSLVELIPVPAWRGIHLSLGFPLLIALAILWPPTAAGVTAFVGSTDPREFRGEVTVLRAVFNRAQVALSVFAASSVFHWLVGTFDVAEVMFKESPIWLLVVASMVAAIADYLVNSTMVTLFTSLRVGLPPLQVMKELRIGTSGEFFVSYLGLGVLGLVMAAFTAKAGLWSLPVFLAPLL